MRKVFVTLFGVLVVATAHVQAAAAQAPTAQRGAPSAIAEVTTTGGTSIDVSTAATVHGCPYLYFCAYSGANYTGTKIQMYFCQFYDMPFSGDGSWVNNQTPGTVARFYDYTYRQIGATTGAYSQHSPINWTPVYHVKPC